MKLETYSALLLLLCLLLMNAKGQVTRAAYGDTCNSTLRCSQRDWLSCNNGTCGCIKPETMIYEARYNLSAPTTAMIGSGKCATMVGERCKFNLGADDNSKPIFDAFPCTQNAECDDDGFCVCLPGYYENWNGTCARFQEHMQPCNDKLKCKDGLHCLEGLCQCESDVATFNSKLGKCVGALGSPCIDQLCSENAICSANPSGGKKCSCQPGFFENKERKKCLPKIDYGQSCSDDLQCGSDKNSKLPLKCLKGKCECDPTTSTRSSVRRTQVYDRYERYEGNYVEVCASKPGKECEERFCTSGSYCTYENRGGGSYTTAAPGQARTCVCSTGTRLSNSTGLCQKDYHQQCQTGQCAEGLLCKEGRCECPYPNQNFESDRGRCVSRFYGFCTTNDDCGERSTCRRDPTKTLGRCVCQDGYLWDEERQKCKGTFNTTCEYGTSICDSDAGLVCIEGRCACQYMDEMYSTQRRKCVGTVGATCETSSSSQRICSPHSTCVNPPSDFYRPASNYDNNYVDKFCTCNAGYIETEARECELRSSTENASLPP